MRYSNVDIIGVKHLEVRPVVEEIRGSHAEPYPELLPLDITYDTVVEVEWWLFSLNRPGGTEIFSLQLLILCFAEASNNHRNIFALITECLAND